MKNGIVLVVFDPLALLSLCPLALPCIEEQVHRDLVSPVQQSFRPDAGSPAQPALGPVSG